MFDSQLTALGRLNKTKTGRAIITEHREAILACLAEGAAKS